MRLDRYIKITISNGITTYDSENNFGITAGSMKFDEALCDTEFSLKELCSSKFEVQCFNLAEDVTGWNIHVAYKPVEASDSQYTDIFNGIIDSSTTDNFNDFRDIIAYDRLYTLRDEDVGEWWDTFWSNRPAYTEVAIPVGSPVNNHYYELSVSLEFNLMSEESHQGFRQINGTISGNGTDPNWLWWDLVSTENYSHIRYSLQGYTTVASIMFFDSSQNKLSEIHGNGTITDDIEIPNNASYVAISARANVSSQYAYLYDNEYMPSEDTEVDALKTYYYNIPIATIGEIRTALCTAVGLTCESTTLVNDSIQTKKYLSSSNNNVHTQITFGNLMSMICEINGVIGHIDRDGTFIFVTFDTAITQIGIFEKANAKFEDYETTQITGVNVYESSENLMLAYGDSTNTYKIAGNMFTLALDDYSILTTMCSRIFNQIVEIQYTPCSIPIVVGDLSIRLGNKITTAQGTHYVMSQSYSNSLLVDQTIDCIAYGDVLRQEVSDINNNVVFNQKYSSIMQNQEMISMVVAKVEEGLNDYITRLVIEATGVKIFNTRDNPDTYSQFTQNGMELFVDAQKVAWATVEGFAAQKLMVGESATKWYMEETNDGYSLIFTRR